MFSFYLASCTFVDESDARIIQGWLHLNLWGVNLNSMMLKKG